MPFWQLMDGLRQGDAYPAAVRDDTSVLAAARGQGLAIRHVELIMPEPRFDEFAARLDSERQNSQYSFGYPDGEGDCNCVTWLERLGLPLLTGRMDELFGVAGLTTHLSRRFGACT